MRVKFIGATHSVTGSCTLLHHLSTNTKFLVDCGMYQGGYDSDWLNAKPFPFDPKELKYILLTHAHLDHCGLIPKLYKEGFVGKVLCTGATAKLAMIVMRDCSKISDIYSDVDVNKVKFSIIDDREDFIFGKNFIPLDKNLRVKFIRSSHILGATGVIVNWGMNDNDNKGKTILFSGDIGNNYKDNSYLPLLKHNHFPFIDTDYILVESTYGGRRREDNIKDSSARLDKLKEIIESAVIKNKGKLLIPAFSIHRTQELLVDLCRIFSEMISEYTLKKYLQEHDGRKRFRIYFHSGMATEANKVFSEELLNHTREGKYKYKNKELEIDDDVIKDLFEEDYVLIGDSCIISDASSLVISKKNKGKVKPSDRVLHDADIIISSSGMCDFGPVVEYIKKLGADVKNTILFTGYLASGSKGSRILKGEEENIKAKVENMAAYYSAHADEDGLLRYIFEIYGKHKNKTKIFINHGEMESKAKLKSAIEKRSSKHQEGDRVVESVTTLNGDDGWFDLDTGENINDIDKDVSYIAGEQLEGLHKKIDNLTNMVELLLSKQ